LRDVWVSGSGFPPKGRKYNALLRSLHCKETPIFCLEADNDCTNAQELWAQGSTPLNGLLRDTYRYLSTQWTNPPGTKTYASPIADNGERACRQIRYAGGRRRRRGRSPDVGLLALGAIIGLRRRLSR
jgi:hypothetical protein